MSAFFVALLFSLGAAAWVYSKFMERTGGNAKSSLTTAAICGVGAFAILFIILSFVL